MMSRRAQVYLSRTVPIICFSETCSIFLDWIRCGHQVCSPSSRRMSNTLYLFVHALLHRWVLAARLIEQVV